MTYRTPGPLIVAFVSFLAILALAAPSHLRRTLACGEATWYRVACPPPAPAPEAARPKVCDPAWSCGRLAKGEAGMKPDTWYLKYEDVDGPMKLEIVFRDGARCSIDEVAQDCATILPTAGSESVFTGARMGDRFLVSVMGFRTRK